MKRVYFFALTILLIAISICLVVGNVSAIGMQGGSKSITAKKGVQAEFTFPIMGAAHMTAALQGNLPNLTKYATLIDPDPGGGPRTLIVKLNFYEDIPPGRYEVVMRATEQMEATAGTIVARTAIEGPISVLVLFPGKMLEWNTNAKDINVNETGAITAYVTSLGTDKINDVRAKFDIFDEKGKLMLTTFTNSSALESDKTLWLVGTFQTNNWPKGYYSYNATVFWDGNEEKPKPGSFRIGSLQIYIKGFTNRFIIDAVNLFQITVESDWSGTIKDVYADIVTPNKNLKTPNIDMQNFQQGVLETYWDTTGLGKGEVPVTINVNYGGKTTTQKVMVNITETGKGVELPKKETFLSNLSTTTIILLVVVVLLIANFLFFLLRAKKNEKKN